ncbi:hypothetical protein [Methylomonas methanica]|uniref:Uncharacterized protein n=1 Tax=Methylomonas methanica (strain DSM 25384 / MC09) TaxID=857087 RepID=F9ZWI5_METMM|nr:hypothetical protein [Methylomonas methanica]AEF99654.1 hypothetical protein Metme_1226 [Methylomonas methanica MC09]
MKVIWSFSMFLLFLLFMPVSYAKPWDITEEMIQEMVEAMPAFEQRATAKLSCRNQVKFTRIENQKGFNIEITLLEDGCIKDLYLSRELMIDEFKLLAHVGEMASWYQLGLFFNYIYKDKNNKILADLRIDREAIFGEPISIFHEEENTSKFFIDVGDQKITLNSFGLPISDLIVPGKPVSDKYCDIEFKQERSFFVRDNVSLSFSVIQLSQYWPVEEQLHCINIGDFDLIFLHDYKNIKVLYSPKDKVASKSISLIYKVVYKSEEGNKMLWVAFSGLLEKRKAVYFAFGGPENESTEQLIKNIMSSVIISNKSHNKEN